MMFLIMLMSVISCELYYVWCIRVVYLLLPVINYDYYYYCVIIIIIMIIIIILMYVIDDYHVNKSISIITIYHIHT